MESWNITDKNAKISTFQLANKSAMLTRANKSSYCTLNIAL